MKETYKVSLSVSKRIKTAQDLSDFYAFVESFNGSDTTYFFPTSEQERIDKLVGDICYSVGIYNEKNVARIVRNALKYEMSKRNARQKAIDYQMEQSAQTMSYGELVEQQNYFYKLGKRYGLIREFKENGIL